MISKKVCRLRDYFSAFEMEGKLTEEKLSIMTGSSIGGARMGRYRLEEMGLVRPLFMHGKPIEEGGNQVYEFCGGQLPEKYLSQKQRKKAKRPSRSIKEIIETIRAGLDDLERMSAKNEAIAKAVLDSLKDGKINQ